MYTVFSGLNRAKAPMLLSLALSFLLAVYAPLELYFTNQGDFWFDFPMMLPYIGGLFFACLLFAALVFFLCFRINRKLYDFVLGAALAALLAFYVQGNFLVAGLPKITGDRIDWNAYPGQRIASLLVWVLIPAAVFLAYRFLGRKTMGTIAFASGGFLFLMLLATLITVGLSTDGFQRKGKHYASKDYLWEFSGDRNIILLVLDSVDGDYFRRMLDETPEYKEAFADFTFYGNALTSYGYTSLSVPHILTGEWYECQSSYEDYVANALSRSPFLSALEKNSYKLELYEAEVPVDLELNHDRFANLHSEQPSIGSQKAFLHCVLQMAGLKYAPFDVKRICYDIYDRLDSLMVHNDYYDAQIWFDWYNHPFYNDTQAANPELAGAESRAEMTDSKVFKWIHLEGSHTPFRAGPHMEFLGDAASDDKERYYGTVEGMAYLTRAYLDMLRANGIYDNTAIIVMSDHGRGLDLDKTGENMGHTNLHPIVMAKGFGEHHDTITVSDAPISYDDLQTAFQRLMTGSEGNALFDAKEGQDRPRRFIDYEVGTFSPLIEYQQTGYAGDLTTLIPTGTTYELPAGLLQ